MLKDLSTLRLLARRLVAGRKVYASVSGGKDSVAMGLYFKELEIEFQGVFADTGWEHPFTVEHLRGPVTDALGPIIEVRGELNFVELVLHKGMFPSRVRRFCTELLKVEPIKKYLLSVSHDVEIVNAVGIRRDESQARANMPEWEWDDLFDCEVWRPLVEWTRDDVVAIHKRHDVPLNPLYALGFKRVGCYPCIHENKKGIALGSKLHPEPYDIVRMLERKLNAEAVARYGGVVEDVNHPRTMFSYHGGDSKHIPINIDEAIEWANSKRGEWQPPGAGDGCMRFGLCESQWVEDEPEETDCAVQTVSVLR